jgi:hypothetical protein
MCGKKAVIVAASALEMTPSAYIHRTGEVTVASQVGETRKVKMPARKRLERGSGPKACALEARRPVVTPQIRGMELIIRTRGSFTIILKATPSC